ncbi:Golgi apyrase [Xylographa vitiligo]|nr:Golgi apyrase [Xylographa vitiligo]
MARWQYGIVADAGSSGTRIHIYRWLKSTNTRQEAEEHELRSLPVVKTKKKWTKKIKPGISTFGDKPGLVGPDHLKELFDHALDIIPEDAVDGTPMFLLATAGVRLLPEMQREELLHQICSYAQKNTRFLLPDCALHIQVIPGETEGLYGWIAANYLLGGFDSPQEHDHGKGHHTYGFLDMGGASAQIAFAPNTTEAERHADDLKLLRMRTVNGVATEYRVFVTTWLGFGVHEARKRYVEALLQATPSSATELPDPCLPVGLSITTKGDMLLPDSILGKEPALVGTGKFDECLSSSQVLLNKTVACIDPPCLINGVHVPAIDFDVNHFVGVSEYWHTTHEIFEMGFKDKAYDFRTYQTQVKQFCGEDWTAIQGEIRLEKWGEKVDEAIAAEACFKASWLINVLHEGIGIPRIGLEDTHGNGYNGTKEMFDVAKSKGFTDPFQAVDKIDDTEVSWTLGKMVLYAASQVPPSVKANFLPVGFGSNVAGIPADFQYAGLIRPSLSNQTHDHIPQQSDEQDGWKDVLFEGKTPRRIPGFLLFMVIICIAVFLLCGKDRRSRMYHKIAHPFIRGHSNRRRGLFTSKSAFPSSRSHDNSAREHLLEGGIVAPEDFELGSLDGESDEHSDSSLRSMTVSTSGRATPKMRSQNIEHGQLEITAQGVGLGLGPTTNAMDRSGLFVRTESREKLPTMSSGEGRRSRRGSLTRFKTPLMSPLKEY